MIEKTRKILTAILSIIVIVFVVYGVFVLIVNQFKKPDLLTKDEIKLYTIESNLELNYTTFYYIDSCLANIVEGARRGLYNELYDCYIKDYKEQYTKEEVYAELREFGVDGEEYSLKAVYNANGLYILEYEMNGQLKTMLMTFSSKNTSYEFAIVK